MRKHYKKIHSKQFKEKYSKEFSNNCINDLKAILNYEYVYFLADSVLHRSENSSGRKLTYPIVCGVIYMCMYSSLGSLRKSASFLGEKEIWEIVRNTLKAKLGLKNLPIDPPERHHFIYLREKFLYDVDYHSTTFTNYSAVQAMNYGALDKENTVLNGVDSKSTIIGDGKVIKSPIISKTFHDLKKQGSKNSLLQNLFANYYYQCGEPRKIKNPKKFKEQLAKKLNVNKDDLQIVEEQYEKDGTYRVFGSKWVILSIRLDNKPNFRLILSVRPQDKGDDIKQTYPGEVGVALDNLLEIQDLTGGGINFVTYDGAMRGKHCKIVLDNGIIPITPLNGHTKFKSVEIIKCEVCKQKHEIYVNKGKLCVKETLDTGESIFTSLDYKLSRNEDKNGYRFYVNFTLECGKKTRFRLNEDINSSLLDSFKIFKGLKPKTKDSKPIYDYYRGLRQDAESFNRLVEDKTAFRQTVGYSRESQYLNMLSHMILNNARCAYQYQPL